MTNYECYFGTKARAKDSLSLLIDYDKIQPRAEVIQFQDEVRKTGAFEWLESECLDQRWFANRPLNI